MLKRKIKRVGSFFFLIFFLTSCPMPYSRYRAYNTTEQGTLYSFSLKDNPSGVVLDDANTRVYISRDYVQTDMGSMQAYESTVEMNYSLYNNLEGKQVSLELPFSRSMNVDDISLLENLKLNVFYEDGTQGTYLPQFQMSSLREVNFQERYDSKDEASHEKEIKEECSDSAITIPTTFYAYYIDLDRASDDEYYFPLEDEDPIFVLGDENEFLISSSVNHPGCKKLTFFDQQGGITFYLTKDYTSIYEEQNKSFIYSKSITLEELLYTPLKNKTSWEDAFIYSYLHSKFHLQTEIDRATEDENVVPYGIVYLNQVLDDEIANKSYLQNYLLTYNFYLPGNHSKTDIRLTFPTRIEKDILSTESQYLLSFSFEGLASFNEVNAYSLQVEIEPPYYLSSNYNLTISESCYHGNEEFQKKNYTAFELTLNEDSYFNYALYGFKYKKERNKYLTFWRYRLIFAGIFLIIYFLMQKEEWRRKAYAYRNR